jgi:hypothetical protein
MIDRKFNAKERSENLITGDLKMRATTNTSRHDMHKDQTRAFTASVRSLKVNRVMFYAFVVYTDLLCGLTTVGLLVVGCCWWASDYSLFGYRNLVLL